MRSLIIVFILIFSLQAKERTMEEALANSKKFIEKASAFQESFGQPSRPQLSMKEYKTVDIMYLGQFDMNGKTRYYDIDVELETCSSKDNIVLVLDEVVKELKLPMDKGYYIYKKDEIVDKKMLGFFQKRVDVKSLKIKKLVLQ